jgi:hypothetical protein
LDEYEDSWYIFYEEDADGTKYDAEQPVIVCWRLHKQATYMQQFKLHRFPLDTQALCVEVKAGWSHKQVRLVQNRNQNYKSLCRVEFFSRVDDFYLSDEVTFESTKTPRSFSASFREYPLLRLNAHLMRKSGFYQLNIFLPLFLMVILAQAGVDHFHHSHEDTGEEVDLSKRMVIPLAMFLATVLFQHTVVDMLPATTTTTTTLIDRYILFVFFAIFLIAMQSAFTLAGSFEWLASLGWYTPELEDAMISTDSSVPWLTVWMGGWIGLHAVILVAILYDRDNKILADEYLWWNGGTSTVGYLNFPRCLYCGQWYKLIPSGSVFNFLKNFRLLSDLRLFRCTKSVELADDQGGQIQIKVSVIDRRRYDKKECSLVLLCEARRHGRRQGSYRIELSDNDVGHFKYEDLHQKPQQSGSWHDFFSWRVGLDREKQRIDCRWLVDSICFEKFDSSNMYYTLGTTKAQREGLAAERNLDKVRRRRGRCLSGGCWTMPCHSGQHQRVAEIVSPSAERGSSVASVSNNAMYDLHAEPDAEAHGSSSSHMHMSTV